MENIVRILGTKEVTHDVKCFRTEKPSGYQFIPGQATELSINKPGLKEEKRPFTFTSLNEEPYLEFTIKRYKDHQGVTDKLHQLERGDELIIRDVWGAIEYKGPGYFIAGGAGITPFISILRQLNKEKKISGNTLFFSNKTSQDIIYERELSEMLGNQAIFILTKEKNPGYKHAYLNESFLKENITDFHKHFYICGPDPLIHDINSILTKLGAKPETVIFEK
jgi:glycine betaine catabolism B